MTDHDEQTRRYFDRGTPDYSLGRYGRIVDFLAADAGAGASLLDVGCGTGNVLQLLGRYTPVSTLAGIDVSRACLEQCSRAVPGCITWPASILDDGLRETLGRCFRYVLVGAVLHHLVGASRACSLALARRGLASAWSLVEPGGSLIISEPTFRPRWAMATLFHVKRLVSRLTTGRIALFGYWNNLGEPVVSYLSHDQLARQAGELAGGTVCLELRQTGRLPPLWRLAGVTERASSVLIVRKAG